MLKGLTAATAGSMGLAFGSGAFTQVEADRSFNVTVASDDTSSQLVIENTGSDLAAISTASDGTFTIDATGAQPGGLTTFGRFGDITDATTLEQGTFVVRNENQIGEPVDITLQIGLNGNSSAIVELAAVNPTDNSVSTTDTNSNIGGGSPISLLSIPSANNADTTEADAQVECGLVIDTTAGGVGETLTLTFAVKAVRSAVTTEPTVR